MTSIFVMGDSSTATFTTQGHFKADHVEKKLVDLPKQLESVPRAKEFPTERHRWNTNEEVAGILIALERHDAWQKTEVQVRPASGTMLLYSRKKVRYRKDGYCWKKRKDGKTTREDHMKLKVQGVECIYGCYVHSSILPTFHRRCYWLLQNPDIVLVHYLNVPYTDDNKMAMPSLIYCPEKKEWTREELICQLLPMYASAGRGNNHSLTEQMTEEAIGSIVDQLMEQQLQRNSQTQVQECGCFRGIHDKACKLARQRIITPKSVHPHATGQLPKASISIIPQSKSTPPASHHQVATPPSQVPVVDNASMNKGTTHHLGNMPTPTTHTTPLILSLSQLHGNNGFIILSSQTAGPISVVPNSFHLAHISQAAPSATVTTPSDSYTNAQKIPQVSKTEKLGEGISVNTLNSQSEHIPHTFTTLPQNGQIDSDIKLETDLVETLNEQCHVSMEHEASCGEANLPDMGLGDFNLHTLGQNLQLTSEEVQRTLSANLPATSTADALPDTNSEVNTSIETVRTTMVSPESTDLNLDTFDLLDLPDFDSETLANSVVSSDTMVQPTVTTPSPVMKMFVEPIHDKPIVGQKEDDGLYTVSDFSPEWAFTEGGTKVLVTGPWYQMNSQYSVLFDETSVQATLVQAGVLRCYCPAHSSGLVSLRVACDSVVISHPCMFEYKPGDSNVSPLQNLREWFKVPDNQLKLGLTERLQEIEKRLAAGQPSLSEPLQVSRSKNCQDTFEERMVEYVYQLRRLVWARGSDLIRSVSSRMTLLHLAAALGYTQLISALIQWREENPSLLLEYEVDALSIDDQACTPMMWACAKGKLETVVVLHQWNSSALNVCNNNGLVPVHVALSHSHHDVAQYLDQVSTSQNQVKPPSSLTQPLSASLVNASSLPSQTSMFMNHQIMPSVTSPLIDNASQPWHNISIEIPPPPPYPGNTKVLHRKDSTASAPPMSSPVLALGEDSLAARRARLQKRISVDVLPNFPKAIIDSKCPKQDSYFTSDIRSQRSHSLVEGCRGLHSDPNLTLQGREEYHIVANDVSDVTMHAVDYSSHVRAYMDDNVAMDTDSGSPFIDVEGLTPGDDDQQLRDASADGAQHQMVTLANQIIAAMPERIKSSPGRLDDPEEVVVKRERSSSHSSYGSHSPCVTPPCQADDSGISTPLGEGIPSFDEYRYTDLGTPASSLSPASTSCLQSPYSFTMDSPPPTTAEFNEYFNAPTTYMEKDFSKLTLSDQEQRNLYKAARIIQHCYRRYKDKQQQQTQKQKEIEAAILIQSYYRRYKQYAYYKKMCHAAVLIQSQFRSYYAQKRFKRSREAATVIQNQYRAYKEHERFKKSRNAAVIIQQRFRSHYQRKRNQVESSKRQDQTVEASLSEDPEGHAEAVHQSTDSQSDTSTSGHVTSRSTENEGQRSQEKGHTDNV